MTEPPVDWQAEATRWRDAYLALIEHAMDTAAAVEQTNGQERTPRA